MVLPTPWTSKGVGTAIPASELGQMATTTAGVTETSGFTGIASGSTATTDSSPTETGSEGSSVAVKARVGLAFVVAGAIGVCLSAW